MTPPAAFAVHTTSSYNRLSNKLQKSHRDFDAAERNMAAILSQDPFNRTRQHHIKKLEAVAPGDGQFRIRLGRWRFRYDIIDQVVLVSYCGLRREDTY